LTYSFFIIINQLLPEFSFYPIFHQRLSTVKNILTSCQATLISSFLSIAKRDVSEYSLTKRMIPFSWSWKERA
ncbi:hypothetical protein, partial [Listeria monocytogenes]|uniref:hypothetical protein n=3 Tax=Listeria monocytogenes TaxID=1639 RepID=UPI001C400504